MDISISSVDSLPLACSYLNNTFVCMKTNSTNFIIHIKCTDHSTKRNSRTRLNVILQMRMLGLNVMQFVTVRGKVKD